MQFLKSSLKPLKFLNLNPCLQLLKYEGVFLWQPPILRGTALCSDITDACPTVCPMQTNTHTLSPKWTHVAGKSDSQKPSSNRSTTHAATRTVEM